MKTPWKEFDVIFGKSSIYSQRRLSFTSPERADRFLTQCGFDPADPHSLRQFDQIWGEAVFFIRHVLLTPEECQRLPVPAAVAQLGHPRDLLLLASDVRPRFRYTRRWACAVLKVMFVIGNLNYSVKLDVLQQAREQIFSKIKRHLRHTEEDFYVLEFADSRVNLSKVEWKEAKTRSSILLKLLQKPESLVEEVFDYLGVRFIVSTAQEIPLLLTLLIDSDIVLPHQVVKLRTRNNLIDVEEPHRLMALLESLTSSGIVTPDEETEMKEKIPWRSRFHDASKQENAFSSQNYRSLQMTVRHLVRMKNPAYEVLQSLAGQLHRLMGLQEQDSWLNSLVPQSHAVFFPMEIQILDEYAYTQAKFGKAAHELYKDAQMKAVRTRVLGGLEAFTPERLKSQTLDLRL